LEDLQSDTPTKLFYRNYIQRIGGFFLQYTFYKTHKEHYLQSPTEQPLACGETIMSCQPQDKGLPWDCQ